MKKFMTEIFAEAFKGRTPLAIAKSIIAFFVVVFVITIACMSSKMNGSWVALWICVAIAVWNFLGLSGIRKK